jgi:hypothetical protein
VIVSIAEFPQIAQFGQHFAKNEFGFSQTESPIQIVFQKRSVVRLEFLDPFGVNEAGPLGREEDNQDQ